GYSIDDLLQQDALLDAVEAAVSTLVEESRSLLPLLLVGAPVRFGNRIYNTALAVHRGRLLGVVPKVHLPNYREFYESRQFASGRGTEGETIGIGGHEAPFGPDLIFETEDVAGHAVPAGMSEEFWVPRPARRAAAPAGATVRAQLPAST